MDIQYPMYVGMYVCHAGSLFVLFARVLLLFIYSLSFFLYFFFDFLNGITELGQPLCTQRLVLG